MISNIRDAFNLLIFLGSVSRIQSDPIPGGFDGYGDSSNINAIGSSNSKYDQEYPGSYGSRRDFDEGHKEDIEQESIKYHSLVNKALNTAKDADRFIGESIKEQEKSQKEGAGYPRIKRSVVPLAPGAKRNFRPLTPAAAPPAPAAVAVAPVVAASVQQPAAAPAQKVARQQGPSGGPAEEVVGDNALPQSVAATGAEEDYSAGGDVEGGAASNAEPKANAEDLEAPEDAAAPQGGAKEGGTAASGKGSEINPEKIDEMIDLMNSLNQKFAQMIANWDDYAATQPEGARGAGGAGDESTDDASSKKKLSKLKKAPSKAAEGSAGDYEEGEEAEGEETEGAASGGSGQRRLRQLPHIL